MHAEVVMCKKQNFLLLWVQSGGLCFSSHTHTIALPTWMALRLKEAVLDMAQNY